LQRREFIKLCGAGMGTMMVPVIGNPVMAFSTETVPFKVNKQLASIALDKAKQLGASYSDARIGRYLNQFIFTREQKVRNLVNTESYGVGIRVLVNGTWGFSSTNDVSNDGIANATAQAVAIAKANSRYQSEKVQLAAVKGAGDVQWRTPIEIDAIQLPVEEKINNLLDVNKAATQAGASFVSSNLFMVNEQKFFASSDNSYIEQDVHRIWPTFTVTKVDRKAGKFKTRNALSAPRGMGYEYLLPDAKEKYQSTTTLYRDRYDMVEDARLAAEQAAEKVKADSIKPGKYDLVLDPSHLFLTIHESVGHPLELDRVLGYEANLAGTSFATLDKWRSGTFNYGSDKVNLVADKTQPGSLGNVAYDDEGVKTKQWDLVRNGVLKNYQATRDQVHILGEKESHGCCYADNWNSVQFQRMPNVSLEAPDTKLMPNEMIKNVENGIYILGRGSYSIDQQRYNFQFGGQLFYAIKNGEITGMVEDVAYQSNTQEFWNSCTQLCGTDDYRLGGTFFDGKGQPVQVSAVSHGCPTSRFDQVNVINTARKL